jgi:hypothetical protein
MDSVFMVQWELSSTYLLERNVIPACMNKADMVFID